LQDVTTYINRGIAPNYTEKGELIAVNQRCIRNGFVNFSIARKVDSEKKKINSDKMLKNYDILINSTGVGTLGRIGQILKLSGPATVDSHVTIVRPDCEKIDPIFLSYYLKKNQKYIENMAKGSTGQIELSRELIKKIKVPISCRAEQKAIAKVFSDLDDKIELLQKQNKTLEAIGQALFKHWFVDFEFPDEKGRPYKSSGGKMMYSEEMEKEIPKGWEVSKIGDEFETILGGTPSTSNKSYWENGAIPWINSGAINEFPIINASQHITKVGLENSATKLMPKKTVVLPFVISINKDIRISITAIKTCGNQSVLGIIGNEKTPCEFIYYWIEYMKEDIYSWATGGAQQHINKNKTKTMLTIH